MSTLAERLEGYDVVLVLGAPVFRYYPYQVGSYLPEGTSLLQVSNDPSELARAPVGDGLLSDIGLFVDQLLEILEKEGLTWNEMERGVVQPPAKISHDRRLTPSQVFASLNYILPKNLIIVEETPSNAADIHLYLPTTEPDSFYSSASGILGWGLPAAIGVALAQHEMGSGRPVLAIIGDGSFQYSIQSIWTACQQKLAMLILVLRNEEYAILKAFADFEDTPGVPGLDLPGIDIVSLAKGYGCHSYKVNDLQTLQQHAANAWLLDKPTVLEVLITKEIPPLL